MESERRSIFEQLHVGKPLGTQGGMGVAMLQGGLAGHLGTETLEGWVLPSWRCSCFSSWKIPTHSKPDIYLLFFLLNTLNKWKIGEIQVAPSLNAATQTDGGGVGGVARRLQGCQALFSGAGNRNGKLPHAQASPAASPGVFQLP